ncbi:uncharacterized protein LOC134257315 [Saccostrea cucullata]|uniref:uncharacterized protein LOC134257315 n=1 Tax=Saccostrea cuccullata TaxID=36930 RepID=UPI002ED28FEA
MCFYTSFSKVSSKETNASTTASTEEFKNFRKSLNRVILESERTRLVQHLRFLQDVLKNIRKGIDCRLALGKRSGEEQRALEEKHNAKMKELKTKCVEEGRKLLEDMKKMIQDEAEEIYDYMSSDLGKDKILNPPGHMNLMDIQYIPSRLEKKVKGRVEMYVQGVLHSEKIQEKFLILRRKALDFYTEVSSDISEIEGEWTNNSEGAHHEDCQEVSMAPYMTGVIASSPLWIPALAVGIGLAIATLGVGFVASPIIAPVLVILLRKERRRKIMDKEYENCMQTIRSTICNHLKIMYGDVLEKLIKKISTDILPRKIRSLEKLIEERKVEIEMSITLIKQIDRSGKN